MTFLFSALIVGLFSWLCFQHRTKTLALIPALSPLYLIRLELGPVPTTLFEILILIALGAWATTKPWQRIAKTPSATAWTILFSSVVIVGLIIAKDSFSALGIAKAYYIEPALLFLAFKDSLKKEDWTLGVQALAFTATLLALFGIFQWITGLGLPIPYDFSRRITSVFSYPNAYGLFITPIIAFCSTIGLLQKKVLWKVLGFLLFCTLLISQTEAGIVAILAASATLVIAKAPTRKVQITSAVFNAMLLVVALAIPLTREKLLLQDTSGLVRRSQWQETVQLLRKNPFTGVGFNGYPESLVPYHTHTVYEIFQYPHNFILNAWVEAGILNVLFVLALLVLVISKLKTLTLKDPLPLAAVLALLTMFVHGLVDVPFYKNDLAVLAVFFLALMVQRSYANEDISSHTSSVRA